MPTALEEAITFVRALVQGADDYRKAQLCGYLSVIAVREFELEIRGLLTAYATKCHVDFGQYITQDLSRLNGRISVEDINARLGRFGSTVKQKFVNLHQKATTDSLASHRLDAVNAYNSIISNRHQFVHSGNLTISLDEAQKFVELAPRVVKCVSDALT